MVTPELIDYVNKQRELNVSDEVIRNNLISNSWSTSDIDEVLKPQINSPQNIEEKKPWIFKLFFVFSLLNTLSIVYRLISFIVILLVLDNVFIKTNGVPIILRDFPLLALIPILSLVAYFLNLWTTFKIKNGSKFSFWLYLISNILLILLGFIVILILKPMWLISAKYSGSQNLVSSGTDSQLTYFGTFGFWSLLFTVIPLFFIKKFKYLDNKLSKRAKIIFAVLFLIVAVPIIFFFTSYLYRNIIIRTDYGYSKIQKVVDYHVYKPSSLPGSLSYTSIFMSDKELVGKTNAVRVAFEDPALSFKNGGNVDEDRVVTVINQVEVEENFDSKGFAESEALGSEIREIPLDLSKSGIAYTSSRKVGSNSYTGSNLSFVTKDNVLIYLTSAGKDDYTDTLVKIAENLE